ncbi:MAG TPA: AraC family transcriptional regulator [Gemmatimonadales bacterium]|nr:AraC family transcriptional regulator [Gemmatimonadales bacterium]
MGAAVAARATERVTLRHARVAGFTFTEGTHPADSVIPWHWHPHPTICYVLEGGFTEISGGTAVTCAPATVKFMPGGERHWDRFDCGPARGLLVEVAPEEIPALQPHAAVLDRRVHYHGGEVAELAFRLHRELCRMDSAASLAIEGLMLELLALASRRASEAASPRIARWLSEARDLIDTSLGSHLGVTGVAAAVGVHPVTLARAFRKTFGCTMGEYVRQRRIERAMELLRCSRLPLAEIAMANGFADQSHFSNLFRRKVGLTPSRYRRLATTR